MSFTDHKITQFAHRIADLPDEPQLPAADLKSRFDACPEELRQSLNAVCDDAARLEARVEGIVVDTFGDTIDKEMLSDELAAELDAKAVETSVASRITAEQTARASADTALDTRVTALESEVPQKVEIYLTTYYGTGDTVTVTLPFTPKAVLAFPNDGGEAPKLIMPNYKPRDESGYCGHIEGNKVYLYASLSLDRSHKHALLALV